MTTYANNTVQLAGNGLYASASREAFFLRSEPSFRPNVDPRLPAHYTTVLYNWPSTQTFIQLTSLEGIANVTFAKTLAVPSTGTSMTLDSVANLSIGDYVLYSNVGFNSNVRVTWVGQSNATVGISKPVISTDSTNTVYFRHPVRPLLRIGSEVVTYSNVGVMDNSIRNVVGNIANTRPSTGSYTWPAGQIVSILGSTSL